MKNYHYFLFFIFVAFAIILNSCSPKVYTTTYSKVPQVKIASGVESEQTQGDISVKLEQLTGEYDKSIYKQKVKVVYTPTLATEPVAAFKEFIINYYENLTPFQVTILNNTDHILRMRDARIIYVDPNSDEPVFALNKQYINEDMESRLPVFNTLVKYITTKYPETHPELAKDEVEKALTNITDEIKFVNGFNKEIMPGMKTSGILIFPVEPDKISEGKISFIDVVSKTDAAGNATEKVRFDFKTKLFYKYLKYDPNDNKWVEIDETDFNKGQNNPEKYEYDKKQKKWVLISPNS